MRDRVHRLNRSKTLVVVIWTAVFVSVAACSGTSTAAHSLRSSAGVFVASSSHAHEAAPWCTRAQLALAGPLAGFGGVSGEHELTFALRSTGSRDCSLEGYPTVQLDDPRPMPFGYDNSHPSGPFLSMAPPARVVLAAHELVYLQVVKYRCDLGESSFATRLRVTLPDAAGAFVVALSPPMTPSRSLWWCTGQAHDPGNMVSVSPIRQTAAQLAAQP